MGNFVVDPVQGKASAVSPQGEAFLTVETRTVIEKLAVVAFLGKILCTLTKL